MNLSGESDGQGNNGVWVSEWNSDVYDHFSCGLPLIPNLKLLNLIFVYVIVGLIHHSAHSLRWLQLSIAHQNYFSISSNMHECGSLFKTKYNIPTHASFPLLRSFLLPCFPFSVRVSIVLFACFHCSHIHLELFTQTSSCFLFPFQPSSSASSFCLPVFHVCSAVLHRSLLSRFSLHAAALCSVLLGCLLLIHAPAGSLIALLSFLAWLLPRRDFHVETILLEFGSYLRAASWTRDFFHHAASLVSVHPRSFFLFNAPSHFFMFFHEL